MASIFEHFKKTQEESVDKIVSQTAHAEKVDELVSGKSFVSNSKSPSFFSRFNNKKILIIAATVFTALALVAGFYLFGNAENGDFLKPIVNLKGVSDKVQNPITGELFSSAEAAAWKDVRPLGVMINNHTDARPQVGLIKADLVYEMVAEGGITRFLAFFNTQIPEKVGPIRSAREYYLVLVKELGDAMLMHIGWSPQALVAIESWPVRSLGRGAAPFYRENPRNVAIEHTAYADGRELLKRGMELGWNGTTGFTLWKFKNDLDGYTSFDLASSIAVDFWYPGDYSAIWKYDKEKNVYERYMGYDSAGVPIPHVDDVTKEQITVKNLIVQFATEKSVVGDEKGRLDYTLEGTNSALVFLDGKVIPATWTKEGREKRTMFYDMNGEEIKFNRGKLWIAIVPDRNVDQVKYE